MSTTVTYKVPNISCKHCVHSIKTEVSELAGVQSVEGSPEKKEVKVVFDTPATDEQIRKVLAEINYPAD